MHKALLSLAALTLLVGLTGCPTDNGTQASAGNTSTTSGTK